VCLFGGFSQEIENFYEMLRVKTFMKCYVLSSFMDFNIKKPTHILALLVLFIAFFMIIISPILSFFGVFSSLETSMVELTESVIVMGSLITVLIFIVTPCIWYLLVNRCGIREMLYNLKLRSEGIDTAFLWGVLAAVAMFIIVMVLGSLLVVLGFGGEDLSNIDFFADLSITSMFFIIVVQSVGEEIFFRGFLLEKIESFSGPNMAIFATAILFGLAHMSYGKLYPALMPMIMGILLGFVVVKTRNLYAAIIAHMLFNFISFILYLFAQSLVPEALIL